MSIQKNFAVRHGLEVNTNLILANADTKRVGIGSTTPRYTLDVVGGIGVTDIYAVGVTTVLNELRVGTAGTIFSVIAGPAGVGQSVGVGTANPAYLLDVRSPVNTGQTAFYVKGDSRFTGNADIQSNLTVSGVSTLSVNSSSDALRITQTGTGNAFVVEDSSNPDTTPFVIDASGSVGVGTTIPNYLVEIRSPVSTGQTALYVYGDVRVTGDINVDDITFDSASLTDLNVSGIATIATLGVTGLTTTQFLQVTGVSTFVGFSTFQNSVYIKDNFQIGGISTFRNYAQLLDNVSLYFGDGADLNIYHDGSNSYIQEQGQGNLYIQSNGGSINIRVSGTENGIVANQDGSVELYYDNAKKFETLGTGATVTGTLFTNQLVSSGVATASAYYVAGTQVINNSRQLQNIASLDATTTATIEAAIANSPNTFTDITVSGVSTFVGLATFNSGLQVVSGVTTLGVTTATDLTLQQLNVSGVSTLGTLEINAGVLTATSGIITYYGDGQYLENVTRGVGLGTTGGIVGYGATILYFQGPGISTITVSSGIATINVTGGGSGSASIGIGTTPGEAFTGIVTAGNLWYNSNLGRMFIYYQDQDSAQWVDASPSNIGIITSLTNVSFSAGSATSPSMYFVGDNQTGFFSPSAGQQTFVSTGSSILNINPSGLYITGVATAQDFDSLSDIRYKENINTVNSALLKVDQLRGVKFNWKESGLPSYGVIAQELEEVLPELVHGNDPKTVNYNGIIGVLIEAIKELKAEIEDLKNTK